jgi:hypothetical protein
VPLPENRRAMSLPTGYAKDPHADPGWPERTCDHCGKVYRGPAVFCSRSCAIGDA